MEAQPSAPSLRQQVEQTARNSNNGVIVRSQALATGLTIPQIDTAVRSRRWVPGLARGTLLISDLADSPLARLTSATVGFDAHAWGPSALALWDLVDFANTPFIAAPHQIRSKQVTAVRTKLLPSLRLTRRRCVSTATLHDALASSADLLSDSEFEEAIDGALRDRLTTWPRIEAALKKAKAQGRPGSRRIGRSLRMRSADSGVPLSEWSRRFADKLVSSGLPKPRFEWRIENDDAQLIAQVDLAYPEQQFAIELDSIAFHLNAQAFEVDRSRDAALVRAGWRVSRFTWQQFAHGWDDVIDTINATLAQA